MKVSFITTIYNEESSIISFLQSILKQTRLPYEIIISDGGSTDATIERIRNYELRIKKAEIRFKFLIKKGNRAVGRNEATKRTTGEIIVCSDAGCILDKNWIKNIVEPFNDPKVDVVAGYYKGKPRNIFEKCLIPYVLVMENRVNPKDFLPSTRSIAFKKSIWKKAGGFPEEYSHNEDYVFAKMLKKIGANIVFEKKAIAYWIPRKNFKEAFAMFYRFAFGDSESGVLRDKVLLVFARYLLAFYFVLLSFIERSFLPIAVVFLGLFSYIIWSIKKNYKYVKERKALFFLPLLQFASDLAVLIGTSFGFFKRVSFKTIFRVITNDKGVSLIVGLYVILMILLINWGIPNTNHPFNYFMDEWHQAQSVRTVFTQGSPNVEGSANGSMFHFLLTGFWLIPFILVGYINPFIISSSVEFIDMQQNLFQVLRLNTLFFGVGSIILIAYIARKFFNLNTFLVSFLFVINPIWLTLSNYFKYDIALVFWILLAFLMLLRYSQKPSLSNFSIASFICGIAFSVKMSSLPLLPLLFFVSLFFVKKKYQVFKHLFFGTFIFFSTFLAMGIPDLLLLKGNINEYLFDNLIRTPSYTQNYLLDMSYWIYLLAKGAPSVFGNFLYLIFVLGFILLLFQFFYKKIPEKKRGLYTILLVGLLLFIISLIPLKLEARGNRLLVFLPFITLISGHFIQKIFADTNGIFKKTVVILLILILSIQTLESFSWIYIKLRPNPRQTLSEWMINNIPQGEKIGIENIPIYQFLPDVVLKEFYSRSENKKNSAKFNYEIIDESSINIPNYIVISDEEIHLNYFVSSPKANLIKKLKKEGFKKIFVEKSDLSALRIFRNKREYFISGLIQSPVSISIYKL